jgi:hypothetical protein
MWLVVFVTTFTVLLTVLMLVYRMTREARYNEREHRAELDKLRQTFEKRIYDLTDRLVATDKRFNDVNHLVLSYANKTKGNNPPPTKPANSNFLKAFGVDSEDFEVDPNFVFVLTPFHPNLRGTFEVISEVCHNVGLRCYRGDEEKVEGDLLPHILRSIARARLVIANLNGRNPNVFYELGIAQALDKPIILIARHNQTVPFDVKSQKLILYTNRRELKTALEAELARTLVKS